MKQINENVTIEGINYSVKSSILSNSGLSTAFASVSWNDKNGKKNEIQIAWTNVGTESGYKAIADYCSALAELNNEAWKEFLSYALTGTTKGKKYINYAQDIIRAICDKGYANTLINKIGDKIASKLHSTVSNKFEKFIKNYLPGGNLIVECAKKYRN